MSNWLKKPGSKFTTLFTLTLINMASQLLQKAGLVGDFSPTNVLKPPPPPLIPAVQLVGEKTPTDLSHAFGSGSDKTVPKEGHWRKKPM